MATVGVTTPPDWLRTPNFTKRSDLLEARKQDRQALAFAIEPPLSCDKKFARSDKLYRDSHRPSGALVRSPRQQELDPPPQHYHPRATCSGSPTKSTLVARRQHNKRLESLKFEPSEVERLHDIPKVDQLENWWKRPAPGYVEDSANAAFLKDSLRLQIAHHGAELGPVDPAKTRSAASVDERRLLREKRGQFADKVTHITHQMPEDYACIDSEAVDEHPQERRTNGVSSFEPAWSLPMSPIKVPSTKKKASRRAIENLVLESTSQRVLLDQFKSCQLSVPRALSASSVDDTNGNSGALLSPITPLSQSARGRKAFKHSIRCGGFS
ncbi:hypothetical protein PI124_g7939 [Phytophthora idaei]|nr:hypothetical protein PI125_g7371 [Phytophthora idaei]KAG3160219.1 hypothetical protein PI126_g6998 [Phytophthora idaei]KAG3247372.1 hypothetical protein PI124_g7939 [Phytophthora idaei]